MNTTRLFRTHIHTHFRMRKFYTSHYYNVPFIHEKGKVINQTENCIRRTASLDQLTVKSNYSKTPTPCIFWQLDKATQTDESCLSDRPALFESPSEKMEKVIKHRIQRQSYRSACEHSVSSQTLSPMHGKN